MTNAPTDTPVVVGPFSLEEFFEWVDRTDGGVRFELVDGWPVVNPSPAKRHQVVVFRLQQVVAPACADGFLPLAAPLDWVVLPDRPTVRQPDVLVVSIEDDRPRQVEPPLLTIEVLSPSTRRTDLVAKRAEYAAAGLGHYWVVDPEVPEVVVFAGPGLREVARARGHEVLSVQEPIQVSFTPDSLVR